MADPEQAQAAIVAWLASPDAHGGAGVERIDTHISRVFMAGDRVVKLKRAVRFPEGAPILDFTTLEARRRACEAEVAVNRRTAPDLYLGVAPVLPGPRLGEAADTAADDDALDWVVVMRRFDQDALLDAMARSGALDAELVAALAETVAAFHADAERTPDYGGADAIGRIVAGTMAELARCASGAVEPGPVQALAGGLAAALDDCRALLDERRDAGFVRHCHGDLHLRNICLIDGRPAPFDAIEFNPEIANIDVLYDLAFLLMDLAHRGLNEAANSVLNLYLPHEGDYAGLRTLPLFLALRAAIRAEIAASRAAAGEDADGALAEEACGYLSLAREMLAPSPPRLVAVGGLSGTGKSRIAAALASGIGRAPGAVLIRSDVVRKRLMGRAPTDRLGAEGYTDDVTRRVYASMADRAEAALRAGFSVIADAVHARPEERAAIERRAGACDAAFDGLWLDAPDDVRAGRVAGRVRDASDADEAVALAQARYDTGAVGWRRIDAARPPGEVVDACRMALNSLGKSQRV
jgi:hypothetical protein